MFLSPERLIDGVVRTLTTAVLPEIESRFARGQLFAAVDVLQNLRNRVALKSALAEAEATSLADALIRGMQALRAAGETGAAEPLQAQFEASPAEPAAARVQALQSALLAALEALEDLPEPAARDLRSALGAHLAAQCVRDVLGLAPSLLREISEG